MMNLDWRYGLALALCVGCTQAEDSHNPSEVDSACGYVACTSDDLSSFDVTWEEPASAGKEDTAAIESAVAVATRDGVLDVDDVDKLFEAAGNRVSRSELRAIGRAALSNSFEVTSEANERAHRLAQVANLPDDEAAEVMSGMAFSGTEIPTEVSRLIGKARLHGAVAYDVNEVDEDGQGVWSPYPATTPPMDNMAFDFTQITPEVLLADLEDTDIAYRAIVGTEEAVSPSGRTYRKARYEERKGGTGNILSHYDEVYHPDIYARGSQGQKWANNFAILSDGSLHCLPAARRSSLQNIILTNPHLSRGKSMLYNGHLDVRNGIVVGVEMSGRLSKMAAKGKADFVDPISVLEAWGFEIGERVRLRYGNTRHGVPTRDTDAGVITEDERVNP
jgi:hypothetical protein